jgi:hypothetical protein
MRSRQAIAAAAVQFLCARIAIVTIKGANFTTLERVGSSLTASNNWTRRQAAKLSPRNL